MPVKKHIRWDALYATESNDPYNAIEEDLEEEKRRQYALRSQYDRRLPLVRLHDSAKVPTASTPLSCGLLKSYCTKGYSVVDMAKLLGVHRSTIERNLKSFGLETFRQADKIRITVALEEAPALRAAGMSTADIAAKLNVSASCVYHKLKGVK